MNNNPLNKTYHKIKKLKFHEIDMINLIKKSYKLNEKKTLLDVGSASGNLILGLNKFFKDFSLTGVDTDVSCILNEKKKQNLKKIFFFIKKIFYILFQKKNLT